MTNLASLLWKDHEYRPDEDMVCWGCGEGEHRPWKEELEPPTGWAYQQVCAALHRLESERDFLREKLRRTGRES